MGITFNGNSLTSVTVVSPSANTSLSAITLMSYIYVTNDVGVESSIIFVACGDSVVKSRAKLSMNYSAPNLVYRAGARSLDSDTLQNFTSTTVVTRNTWHHFATTIDYTNKIIRLYVDGVLDSTSGTLTFGSTTTDTSASLGTILGAGSAAGSTGLVGTMADARIYTRLLSADEILTIYRSNGLLTIKNSLQSQWCFNEGPTTATVSGTGTVKDRISSKNATAANSPTYASTPYRFVKAS